MTAENITDEFGRGNESAHRHPHLWERFRSTRAHVDRMWRAFGMSGRSRGPGAEPAWIEHSNPDGPPPASPERLAEALEHERVTAEADARSAAEHEEQLAETGGEVSSFDAVMSTEHQEPEAG